MEYTDNLLLNTPQDADGFDVEHFNDNSDFLDGIIGGDVSSIAAGEERNVATQAHAVGSYLTIKNGTMGGKLYKVTSAIADGNVISTSTNVEETSLINEIKTLQDSLSQIETSAGGNTWRLGDIGWTEINTLSSVSQLTHNGFYHVSTCSNITSSFTDYDTGDFMMHLLANNFVNGHVRYGTLIVTTPRWRTKIWIIQIWDSVFDSAWKIGT